VLAGPPTEPVVVPEAVARIIDGRPYDVVWLNGHGGLTFHVRGAVTDLYVKWMPVSSSERLADEVERLRWAGQFIVVPTVTAFDSDAEGSWMVTRPLRGENAVSERWKHQPIVAATAVGEGLRVLHDALPTTSCPFNWDATTRLTAVTRRAVEGHFSAHVWSDEFRGMSIDAALRELASPPALDVVVLHGDACVPNTVIDDDGQFLAHVDLGFLGLGDRWSDLSVAAWSSVWNYGPGYEEIIYSAYGISADEAKIRYYRLLWELG
jgi:aminoglycoside phosphotransferase